MGFNNRRILDFVNLLKACASNRKKDCKKKQAEPAKKIAKGADNAQEIADVLLSTSFLHSKLPQEILNQKLDPGNPYCDLEYNVRELAREITDQQQTLQADLRSIDRQLLILAQRFQEAVEKGYKTAAFVSMEGLMYGIPNIRNRVPQNDLTFCRQYVKANANYLKEWARLTDLAKGLDLLRENLERHKENYCLVEEEVKKRIDDLRTELKTNAHKRKLFEEFYYQEKPGESLSCSNEGRELYDALIELRLKQINLDLQDCVIKREENRLNSQKGQVTRLREKLNGLPIVQSPNQLNAFQEAMEEMESVLQQAEEVLKQFREEEEMLQDTGGGKSMQK